MKIYLLSFSVALVFTSACMAQSVSPVVLTAAGGNDKTNSVQVEWTLGELAIETVSADSRIYTEGFHQPMLKVESVETIKENNTTSYTINVSPNPVSSVLTVNIQSKDNSKVYLTLTDINGKNLSLIEAASTDFKNIDMSCLASGSYLLTIKEGSGALIQTYKISKLK